MSSVLTERKEYENEGKGGSGWSDGGEKEGGGLNHKHGICKTKQLRLLELHEHREN